MDEIAKKIPGLDEIVKKIGGLGIPAIILLILAIASAGSDAAIAGTLTAVGGPFGLLGGLGLLGLTTIIGDFGSAYVIEAILKALYTERSKTETPEGLLKEIGDLPISDELKTKLKDHLNSQPTTATSTTTNEEPRPVEIVEE